MPVQVILHFFFFGISRPRARMKKKADAINRFVHICMWGDVGGRLDAGGWMDSGRGRDKALGFAVGFWILMHGGNRGC